MLSIVLGRRDAGESDQLISLYTEDGGKISVLAKGVKKITSKNSSNLSEFCLADVELAGGREINRLTKVRPVNFFPKIRVNLQKSMLAGYLISLTDSLTLSGNKDEKLFKLLQKSLFFLEDETNVRVVDMASSFLLNLCRILGFGIETHRCGSCGSVLGKKEAARLDIAAGAFLCANCMPGNVNLIPVSADDKNIFNIFIGIGWRDVNRLQIAAGKSDFFYQVFRKFAEFHTGVKLVNFAKNAKMLA